MTEIVLERGDQPNVMKLDADEEALMNEFEISTDIPVPKPKPKPMRRNKLRRPPPPPSENLDAFTNPVKRTAPVRREPPPEIMDHGEFVDDEYEQMPEGVEEEISIDDGDHEGGMYEESGGVGNRGERPSPGYTSIDDEKADILNKLNRLEKKGFSVNKRLNAYSNIEELRTEYKRIQYSIEVEQSVKFSRRMLIACVTGVEFLNKRYDPLNIQLEGWSESVMENVDDYDGVFEELHTKYKNKVNVAPEIKLIMMLGGSAMMFHLTNSMFKSAIPNMSDVVKQNPDLVKNMISAVQNTQNKGNSQQGPEDPTERPTQIGSDGRKEMKGPGLDLSSLMGGIMMPPPPPVNTTVLQNTTPRVEDDDDNESISDIVSVAGESTGGEVKEVKVRKSNKKSKKKEINM